MSIREIFNVLDQISSALDVSSPWKTKLGIKTRLKGPCILRVYTSIIIIVSFFHFLQLERQYQDATYKISADGLLGNGHSLCSPVTLKPLSLYPQPHFLHTVCVRICFKFLLLWLKLPSPSILQHRARSKQSCASLCYLAEKNYGKVNSYLWLLKKCGAFW